MSRDFPIKALTIVVALLALTLGAAYTYYLLFATFLGTDDEGYILLTIRFFNEGYPLYDDVYSQYGPFFYVLHWLIYRPTGWLLGSDSIRFVTMFFWLATAVTSGWITWRLTRNPCAALFVQIVVTLNLNLSGEPGHPQALASLLAAAVPLLGTFYRDSRRRWIWVGLGILAGLLFMTKVNLGVFLVVTLALLLISARPERAERRLAVAVILAALVMPALLMQTHLGNTLFRNYCFTVVLAMVPVVLMLSKREVREEPTWGDRLCAAAGFLLTVVILGSIICLGGTTPRGLLDGVVLQHRKFAATFHSVLDFGPSTVVLGGLGVLLYQRVQAVLANPTAPRWPIALLKLLFGIAVVTLGLLQDWQSILLYSLPFLWLALIPLRERSMEESFPRFLLVLWTIVQGLQVYPVSGAQLICATFLPVVVAAVCLHDALVEMPAGAASAWLPHAVPGVFALLVMIRLVGSTLERQEVFVASVPLDLPGARRLRLKPQEVAMHRRLTADLRGHADTFLSMPGLNSYYFWSGIDPPTHANAATWMTVFAADRQEWIAEQFARYPRACVIRNKPAAEFWLRGQDIDALPLVKQLDREFVTVDRVGDCEFRVRRPARDGE